MRDYRLEPYLGKHRLYKIRNIKITQSENKFNGLGDFFEKENDILSSFMFNHNLVLNYRAFFMFIY